MFLQSIANANPPYRYTQEESFQYLQETKSFQDLKERSRGLTKKVLLGENGISTRHFSVEDPRALFGYDAGELNQLYEKHAVPLAKEALEKALAKTDWSAEDLDGLFICTCTGYLCPGLSSYVAEQLGIKQDAFLQDLVGAGCGAAIPNLRAASHFLASSTENKKVACIAVEVSSAAFYLNDDPGVLISLCLFADGANATLWTTHPHTNSDFQLHAFQTLHLPEDRELLRFVNDQGKLKNKLHRSVPEKAAAAVRKLFDQATLPKEAKVLCHPGGRDVIDAIEKELSITIPESRFVLNNYGNMSSPSVLFALEKSFSDPENQANHYWLTSFGAGFTAHACQLKKP